MIIATEFSWNQNGNPFIPIRSVTMQDILPRLETL